MELALMNRLPDKPNSNRVAVKVECYAGSRANQQPRRVTINGVELFITLVIESSVEESASSRERIYRFKVMTEDGRILKLFKSIEGDWYLEKRL
jgi:hypothetical protein